MKTFNLDFELFYYNNFTHSQIYNTPHLKTHTTQNARSNATGITSIDTARAGDSKRVYVYNSM